MRRKLKLSMSTRLILSFIGVVLLLSLLNIFLQRKLLSSSLRSLEQKRLSEEQQRLNTFLDRKQEELLHKALSSAEDGEVKQFVQRFEVDKLRRKLSLLRGALSLDVLGVVFPNKTMVFQIKNKVAPVDTSDDLRFRKAWQGKRSFFTMPTNLGMEMRQVVPIGSPPKAALLAGLSLQKNFVEEQKKLFGMEAAVLYEADVLAHTFAFAFRFFPSRILFSMKQAKDESAHVFTTALGKEKSPYYVIIKPVYKEPRGSRQGYIALFMSRTASLFAARRLLQKTVASGLLSFLFVLFLSVFVARSFVKPIVNLAQVAERIARGETKEIAVSMREDEIGHLNKAFFAMTSSLQDVIGIQNQKIEEILSFVRKAGEGDLRSKLSESGQSAFASLAQGLNQMISALVDILRNLTSASKEIAEKATHLLSLSTQQSKAVSGQADKVLEVTSATEENLASLKQLGSIAHSLTEVSQKMKELSERGGVSLQTVIQMMQQIKKKAEMTNSSMDALDITAGDIGDFVIKIEDIAHKIHLLSLNAAIEAARAGEAGRGFSVVAQEIRNLSTATGKLAIQIKDLIEQVQKESKQTKEVSKEEVVAIEKGDQDMKAMVNIFEDLLSKISSCDEISSQIHVATEKGTVGAEQVAGKMRDIEGAVQEVKEVAQQLKIQAESLKDLSEMLSQIAAAFQLPD